MKKIIYSLLVLLVFKVYGESDPQNSKQLKVLGKSIVKNFFNIPKLDDFFEASKNILAGFPAEHVIYTFIQSFRNKFTKTQFLNFHSNIY